MISQFEIPNWLGLQGRTDALTSEIKSLNETIEALQQEKIDTRQLEASQKVSIIEAYEN